MRQRQRISKNAISIIFRYFRDQVIIPNVLWTALIHIPSLLMYFYGVYRIVSEYLQTQKIPLVYAVITLVSLCINIGLIFVLVYFIKQSHEQDSSPRFSELDISYRLISAECQFFFESREHIEQTQDYHIEVLSASIPKITHNLQWTGQTYIRSELDSNITNVTLVDSTRKCSPYPVEIRFEPNLLRGDTKRYSFTTYVHDNSHSMMPFLGKIIRCQTDQLTLRVTAPIGMLKNLKLNVSTAPFDGIELEPPKIIPSEVVGHYDTFKCEISKPELLMFYSLSWEFCEYDN